MTPSWIGRRRLRAAGQDVADRRVGVRVDVEVVREVALRIEVDGERAQADPAEDVRERSHRRRLAGAALLREHRDRLSRHRGRGL